MKKFKRFVNRVRKKIRSYILSALKYINYKIVIPIAYKRYCKLPKNDKLVLFADLRPRDIHENFVDLYKMCEEHGYQCVALNGKSYGSNIPAKIARKAKLKFQFDFLKLFAQCSVLFLVEYFPLADAVTPREGTKIVQLWHGCGAMKTMGYAGTGKGWGASARTKKLPFFAPG